MQIRRLLTILIFIAPLITFGQEWHLNKVNQNEKFKFEYWFSFQNEEDTNEAEIKVSSNLEKKRKVKGLIVDKNNTPIPFANVVVKDITNKVISSTPSNEKGEFSIEVKQGYFQLNVFGLGYDSFHSNIELAYSEEANLKIKLGEAPQLGIYEIHSLRELTPNEIRDIINCVRESQKNVRANLKCENKNLYYILMQI